MLRRYPPIKHPRWLALGAVVVGTSLPVATLGVPAAGVLRAASNPGAAYAQTVLADAPLAYYRFDEMSGARFAANSSTAKTARYRGNASGHALGPVAYAVALDGSGDRLTANWLGRQTTSTWTNGFALEAWAKSWTVETEQHVIEWAQGNGDKAPGILLDAPTKRWKFRDGNVEVETVLATTAWTHVVVSVNAACHGVLSVNGSSVGMWNSCVRPPTAGLFQIGADYECCSAGLDTFFRGRIAEAAVYNHPLSAARVTAHFRARTNPS